MYVTGALQFSSGGNFGLSYAGTTYWTRIGEGGFSIDVAPSTSATVLDLPGRAITTSPDGSIVVVTIATAPNLPVLNAVQPNLNGVSGIYIAKWRLPPAP